MTVVTYLSLTALLSALAGRGIAEWAPRMAIHLFLILAIAAIARSRPSGRPLLEFLRRWYPVLLVSPAYREVEWLARRIGDWVLTEKIQSWDSTWFGANWSLEFSRAFPSVLLSEYLHFTYFAFVLLVPLIGVGWYFGGKRGAFAELVLLVSVTTYLSYLFFIFFPVDSPLYLYPPLPQPLTGHFFHDLVHAIADRAGARGGAFPSTHVSVATVIWFVVWWNQRRLALGLLPILLGIPPATVYGRFHYVCDAIAGLLLGLAVVGVYHHTLARYANQSRRAAEAFSYSSGRT